MILLHLYPRGRVMGIIKNAVRSLRNKILTMIQRTVVTLSKPVVPGEYPTYQVKGLGNKPTTVENISPYGLASTLPLNALGVKWNVQGESSNQVGMSYDPATLPALLAGGETAVGNFVIGSYLKFTALGTIEVYKNNILVIADLSIHIHSGVTTGTGTSGPPVL